MEMEKRFILAMVLSMLFVVLYRYLMVPDTPPRAPVTAPQTAVEKAANKPRSAAASVEAMNPPTTDVFLFQKAATQVQQQEFTIDDPRNLVKLSNRGGIVTSWKFHERKGQEIEIVHQGGPPESYGPLALWTEDAQLTRELNSVSYEVQASARQAPAQPTVLRPPVEITFKYQGPNFRATKILRFQPATFLVEVSAEVVRNGRPVPVQVQVGPGLGASDQDLGSDTRHLQKAAILNGTSVERVEFKKVEALQQKSGTIHWAGVESQYFANLLLPPMGRTFPTSQIRPFTWKEKDQEVHLSAVDAPLLPGETIRVFFGPKELRTLRSIHPTLVEAIDFGWFGIVVEPLLLTLNWINAGVRNYGWAIIILTFLITLALFPLRYKQMVSMKKMQKLQPQVKAIQERYKKAKKSADERQKMNAEMMALYKVHGVNPLGGCLPLVLQMPILFAFYSMLANSFELRGAPFMLWIQDLAARDPYYITPIVMGITMLISMKMTPTTTTDPMQSKMMMIMPIMMTFMFLNLSAGLNLYFLFSNLFSIAMQKLAERYLPAMKTASS